MQKLGLAHEMYTRLADRPLMGDGPFINAQSDPAAAVGLAANVSTATDATATRATSAADKKTRLLTTEPPLVGISLTVASSIGL